MRLYLTCLLFLFMTVSLSYGQTTPNNANYEQLVVPPSPNAAALAKYIDFPVSFANGLPDISIPIYTLTSSNYRFQSALVITQAGLR